MKLTELEGAALGLLWWRGSATAYELRKLVAESPTPHWSASAGTVYPLVAKLCGARLLSFASTGDGRGTRRLRITPLGKRAFRTWMLDCSPAVIGVPPDPVRTRVRFLEQLGFPEGDRLLGRIERRLRSEAARMRAGRRGAGEGESLGESLTLLGALRAQERRVEWITAAKLEVKRTRRHRSGRRPFR